MLNDLIGKLLSAWVYHVLVWVIFLSLQIDHSLIDDLSLGLEADYLLLLYFVLLCVDAL